MKDNNSPDWKYEDFLVLKKWSETQPAKPVDPEPSPPDTMSSIMEWWLMILVPLVAISLYGGIGAVAIVFMCILLIGAHASPLVWMLVLLWPIWMPLASLLCAIPIAIIRYVIYRSSFKQTGWSEYYRALRLWYDTEASRAHLTTIKNSRFKNKIIWILFGHFYEEAYSYDLLLFQKPSARS